MYSGYRRDTTQQIEAEEGQTYVTSEVEEHLTPILCDWMNETDLKKWSHKLRRHVKKMIGVSG